ncbi:hypothetical protein B9Z55_015058 [Caenorhabditis nigoni]|uniref:SUN domain-containing protein n=2 Tax=Caenorhabditis nigoni TaxID=1611254 RepID=A0A2G5U8E8_9PELO|nr:hypothetical protein B9Z55_015058 [Caenorhabditis nigoni]
MLPTIASTFETEDPNTKTRMWHHWFNIRVRQYMILEIFFVISLVMILYRFQTVSNQNELALKRINSMHYRFGNIERKLESLISQIQNEDIIPFDNYEWLEQSIANELKNTKFPKQHSTDQVKPIILQGKQSIFKTKESTLKAPIPKERINAADFMKGATVDVLQTSHSILDPINGYEKANLVLLDRPQPPADKAWCTNAKTQILTINLTEFIKPTSVSYQHSKWNGTIPNGAPKTYDVVACLDFYCVKRKPLVSNCKYSNRESDETEQMCNISSHLDDPSIGKIQFRFRENYGNTKTTCVNLVRVYGETKTPAKTGREAVCTKMRWYYHNSYPKYFLTRQDCSVIYNNKCCSECPECCQECSTLLMKEQLFIRKQVLKTVPKLQG